MTKLTALDLALAKKVLQTEAAAILTGFGRSPGDIDLIVYLNEVVR